jgi:hypothetical protein
MRRQATVAGLGAALAAAAVLSACAEPPPGGRPIDREVFIEAYVDLRVAAHESDEFAVSPEVREAILARHGVSEERLLHFAEVHGPDSELMNEIWVEVERRLAERRPSDDGSA